ncbi:hypothetical protein [Actinomyces sp. MRS3W]|uniref:hypothetical protein n=1 Tax=Actinomyces sp. MRS3W TaxID=2800796 RepID=UPI0028FD3DB5|nr:hypothetical protein [Actinomyces sp. MRS3W]MDU0348919.1 hypothetical protein [Actinomyces sp. MRS3W]
MVSRTRLTARDGTDNTGIWTRLGAFLFAILRLDAVLAVLLLPVLVISLGVVSPLRSFPTLIAAIWLCSPGLAVAFAAFRDCPSLAFSPLRRREEFGAAVTEGVIAAPYWHDDDESAMARPAVRALGVLWRRALVVSLPAALICLAAAVDIVWASRQPFGVYVVPALAVVIGLTLATWPVVLVGATELPRARYMALWRLAVAAVGRMWYLSLLDLAVLVLLYLGLMAEPILVIVLGAGLLLHLVWANARWTILPAIRAVAAESEETTTCP